MATQASSDAPRVLVVDDEAMLADLLSQALRHEGWETATAKDGLDALAKASSFHPDVVILDVQMPRMDGLETLERLRARDPELPVLFLTARDAVADRVQTIHVLTGIRFHKQRAALLAQRVDPFNDSHYPTSVS